MFAAVRKITLEAADGCLPLFWCHLARDLDAWLHITLAGTDNHRVLILDLEVHHEVAGQGLAPAVADEGFGRGREVGWPPTSVDVPVQDLIPEVERIRSVDALRHLQGSSKSGRRVLERRGIATRENPPS